MMVAHELLRRYPRLRRTWPVEKARGWREQQALRAHPRRMASWYRDVGPGGAGAGHDMHTRVSISNLELPEAPQACRPTSVYVTLFDAAGAELVARRFHIARNGTLVLELADLLPARRRGRVPSGQVRVDFEGPQLGSSRAYLHWYNGRSLTSSHEKFGLTIPAVGGYWTVPNVVHSEEYHTHLAVTNLDDKLYSSAIILKDGAGRTRETTLDVPPNGSRFVALEDLFEDPAAFLGSQPGILYFGNYAQPAMYYYFIANDRLGTWRAQHL